MNAIASTPTRTIRARIHDSAIRRVTRIYASTLSDAITEALQNSRRAGATRVRIAIGTLTDHLADDTPDTGETRLTVTIADDGSGIADPAVLLSFGENGWSDELVSREDAAGFGFASLSRRGCTVSSRPRSPDGNTMTGWRVDLVPEHFLGESEAEVRTDDGAPYPHGTSISFQAIETAAAIRHAAEAAAKHYPLPVFFDGIPRAEPGGEEFERRAFLDGAVHAEPWRGLAFGVFRDRRRGYNDPDLNFFGLTLPVGLPTVETVHGGTWSIRADIGDCPELELVLPARKEAVENDFLKEMREAARLAIYRAMAAAPAPRPAFEDWMRAREAGIDIAPPPAVLRPWRPANANVDDWRDPPKLAVPGHGALAMDCDPEPPEAQAFWRAAERAGMATSLFETDRRLAGYDWYDGLDRVTGIATMVATDGKRSPLDDFPLPEPSRPSMPALPHRPAAIRMELAVRPARGPGRTFDLPADLVFGGEPWGWLGDAMPLVTIDSTIQPHRLAELTAGRFLSHRRTTRIRTATETQRDRFDEEALHMATRLLLSDEEACRTSIAEAVRRELLWLCPRDRAVQIRVSRPNVMVTLGQRRRRGVMTRKFTIQCAYHAHYANTVTVEADSLDEALEKAIETANEDPAGWRSTDHCSETYVDAVCEGADGDPWGDGGLPVPDRFSEHGEPPVVTLTGPVPPGAVEVSGGRVLVRIVAESGTVASEVRDPPASAYEQAAGDGFARRRRQALDQGRGRQRQGAHRRTLIRQPARRRRHSLCPDSRSRSAWSRGWPSLGRGPARRGSVPPAPRRPNRPTRSAPMELVTPELRETLLANGKTPNRDLPPAAKFFNPAGAGTWLVVDADPEDTDILHCLADLGFGTPELGSVRLSELESFLGPFGLGIERDLYFQPAHTIGIYAEAARSAGRIVEFGPELDEAARSRTGPVAVD